MASPVKFAHVVYMTRRYDEMFSWYENVFEAKVVHRNPALAFLTYDDEHHRFAFANLDVLKSGGNGKNERSEIGVNHVAYTYSDISDLLDTYARLKTAGIAPYWPSLSDPQSTRLGLETLYSLPNPSHPFLQLRSNPDERSINWGTAKKTRRRPARNNM